MKSHWSLLSIARWWVRGGEGPAPTEAIGIDGWGAIARDVHLVVIEDVQEVAVSEVGVAQLRRDLKGWLSRVKDGDEVVITDRGRPVARLTGVDGSTVLEQLVAEGRVRELRGNRPRARGRDRVRGTGAASEYIVVEREAHR